MKKISILILLLTSFMFQTKAQTILWDSSSDKKLTFLKGEKQLNVEYSFDGLTINGKTESEFLDKRQEESNDKKAGKGDDFVSHWQEVKTKRYPVHFEKAFKKIAKKKIKISQGNNEQYKLLVKLVKAKTGESNFTKNSPAVGEFEISFIEVATGKIMAKARILNAKGLVKAKSNIGTTGRVMRVVARSMNLDVVNRIANCYDSAAISLAKYMLRFNKKKKK